MNYIVKRILNMNYKNFFIEINVVHKESKKPRIFIFFDMINCGFKYKAGYIDYRLFKMYEMNKKERKTIITRGINNDYIKLLNDSNYIGVFSDKAKFNEVYKKYLCRDFLLISEDNYEEYLKFVSRHNEFIAKPLSESCGKGVEKIKIDNTNEREIFDNLISNKQLLLEEVAVQHKDLNKLHPYSINTIRVVTIYGNVVYALLRIGNNKNVVDNFNHEGLCAKIEIEKGDIKFPAIDKKGNVYENHPLTNENIIGFKIPYWQEVVKLVKDASKLNDKVNYIGWDICIGTDKPFIIEANEYPGHDLYQLPAHRDNNIGLKPYFDKVINEYKK